MEEEEKEVNITYKHQVKFYANTPRGEVNKLFVYETDMLHFERVLVTHIKSGFHIKAAWYQITRIARLKTIESMKIKDLQKYFNIATDKKLYDQFIKENTL